MKSIRFFACFVLLAGCSHDVERDNALDPQLTAAVLATATLSDTAGTVAVQWTRYEGDAPFLAYWVLRQQSGLVAVDTLARIDQIDSLRFQDAEIAANVAYDYRVSVVSVGGLEAVSETVPLRPLTLPVVQIIASEFNSATASAQLTWSRYQGPRFAGYELRRSAGDESRVVQLGSVDDTVYVDSGLIGSTEYSYRVAVRTNTGERAESAAVSGAIHAHERTWALDVTGLTASREQVRLYRRAEGVAALITTVDEIRLVVFDAVGEVISDRSLLPLARNFDVFFETRQMAAALLPTGEQRIALSDPSGRTHGIFQVGDDGEVIVSSTTLQLAPLASEPGSQRPSLAQVELHDLRGPYSSSFMWLSIFDQSGILFQTQTEGFWHRFFHHSPPAYSPEIPAGAALQGAGASVRLKTADGVRVQILQDSLVSLRLDIVSQQDIASDDMEFGGWLQLASQVDSLAGSSSASFTDSLRIDYPVFRRFTYDVRLWMADDVPSAVVESPALWYHRASGISSPFASLAWADNYTFHTVAARAFIIDDDGVGEEVQGFDSPVSETRTWHVDGARFARVAVCLPTENSLRMGSVFNRTWTIGQPIDQYLGEKGGLLYYPLSMDGSPDGRMYVLDAGNSRVVVLDEDGRYITQFGTSGSGVGEFNLGDGSKLNDGLNFGGSIAVDGTGAIYVADVGNGRLQKFAP